MSPEPSAMSTEPIEPPHHEPVEGAEGGDTNEDVDDDMEASGSGEAVGHDDLEEPDEVGTSPEIETDGASNAKVRSSAYKVIIEHFLIGIDCTGLIHCWLGLSGVVLVQSYLPSRVLLAI